MTDYDKMEAGREMDAAIAEQVMGWARPDVRTVCSIPAQVSYVYWHVPHYSTEMAAAWAVVEHLCPTRNKSEPWVRMYTSGGYWLCNFHRNTPDVSADTLPLAICRAALMTVSQGVEAAA